MPTQPHPYEIHKAAGIIIKNRKLLVVRRSDETVFVAPGGKIDPGETSQQAVIRELQEELQLRLQPSDISEFGTFYGTATGGPATGKGIRMDIFTISTLASPEPDNEIAEMRWITSDIPNNLQIAAIFRYDVLPRLKQQNLVD